VKKSLTLDPLSYSNGKTERKIMKLPFACELYSDGGEVSNPYSNEKCYLNADALSVYDTIKGAEYLQKYDTVRKGLDWFQKHYPKEYMTLLD